MAEFLYTITDELGLHARPAGILVKKVRELGEGVTLTKGEITVDASKLFAIMGLGIKCGETVSVAAENDKTLAELKKFFEENL